MQNIKVNWQLAGKANYLTGFRFDICCYALCSRGWHHAVSNFKDNTNLGDAEMLMPLIIPL